MQSIIDVFFLFLMLIPVEGLRMGSTEVVLFSKHIEDIDKVLVDANPLSTLIHITSLNLHNNSIRIIRGSHLELNLIFTPCQALTPWSICSLLTSLPTKYQG